MRRQDDALERDLEPTEEELEEARALRDALEGRGEHRDAELARALKLAVDPPELSQLEHQALLNRALHKAPSRKRSVLVAAFGTGTALAAAAAVALLLSKAIVEPPGQPDGHGSAATASLVRSRSTQPLFDGPFPREGGNSQRIDRIAQARSRDFRANRFERMGVP